MASNNSYTNNGPLGGVNTINKSLPQGGVLGGMKKTIGNIGQSFRNGLEYNRNTPSSGGNGKNVFGNPLPTSYKQRALDNINSNVNVGASNPATGTSSNPSYIPQAPTNQDVKEHSITDVTGNTHTQKYFPKTSGLIDTVDKAKTAGAAANPNNQQTKGMISQTAPVPEVPQTPPTPGTPYGEAVKNVVNTSNQGANNILGVSQYNAANPQIGFLNQTAAGNIPLGQSAQDIANAAGQRISDIGQQGARARAGYLTTGTSPVAEGNAAVLANSIAEQQQAVSQGAGMQLQGNAQALNAQNQAQSGYNASGGLALTGQGQRIGATENAAQLAQSGAINAATMTAPQAYGLQNQPYNPTTDTYGGGGPNGAIDRSIQASNIDLANKYNTDIRDTQNVSDAAQANFDQINSIASQGGIDSRSPILTQLRNRYGQTVGGADAPQVAAFNSQLASLNTVYNQLTGNTIPQNITIDGLKAIQNVINGNVKNKIAATQKALGGLKSSSSNSGIGSYTSSLGNSYKLPY